MIRPRKVDGLMLWDRTDPRCGDVTVTHITLRDGEPVYDLVLQQAMSEMIRENHGAPLPVRITLEELPQ